MKVDLLELLRAKSIVHPTTITSLRLIDAKLTMSLTGHPWWRENRGAQDASYEFLFDDVSDGFIDTTITAPAWGEQNGEALEYFSIQSLGNANWAQPSTCQIFCSGPLKAPLALYSKLEIYLEKAEAFKSPKDFLNCGQGGSPLASFAKIASESSFLLARAPEEICALLSAELKRQAVTHNVIRGADARIDDRLRVRLDNSDFLCRSAYAVLPD